MSPTGIRDEVLADIHDPRPVAERATVFEGHVWDVVRDAVDYAPGVRFQRDYVRHTGAVAVLALDEQDRILLIRQYRHPAGGFLWELPAGLLDVAGEDPAVGARRELREEAGHDAAVLHPLVDLRPSPGGSDEIIRVYLATGLRAQDEEGFERVDEEADLVTRRVPAGEVAAAILRGDLTSGTLVAGVLALMARRALGADAPPLREVGAAWPARAPR